MSDDAVDGAVITSIQSVCARLTASLLVITILITDLLLGGRWEPTFDSETTDIVEASERRWARQNHAAAEGLPIPLDDFATLKPIGEVFNQC